LAAALKSALRKPVPSDKFWARAPFARLIGLIGAAAEFEPWRRLLC
jgi:hypothetical protein